jgi:hypothetical protein
MTSHDFAAIDRQLAELGPVPDAAALQALIARHAGGDVTQDHGAAATASDGGRRAGACGGRACAGPST